MFYLYGTKLICIDRNTLNKNNVLKVAITNQIFIVKRAFKCVQN